MKKVGLLVLALVIALGALGAGYAWWTQNLEIKATVNTATFDVGFTAASISDTEATDVCKAEVVWDSESIAMTLDNAYPGYTASASATITNSSTIPVKIALLGVVPSTEDPGFDMDKVLVSWDLDRNGTHATSGTDLTSMAALAGFSLDANEYATLNVTLTIDPEMTDNEDVSRTVTVNLQAQQFNAD